MTNEEITKKIVDEISKTEQLLREYKEMTRPVSPDVSIGRISRMDAINNQAVTESAMRQTQEKLKKLKIALSKVGSSDFGVCVKCKQAIPLGRILIKPESMFCVNCAN